MTKGQTTVPACRLKAHKLTIVQLEFSKDDKYLLSCSRDRQWALFQRTSDTTFELVKKMQEAHSRIIWGISWSHDQSLFATCSRENKDSVKIWSGIQDGQEPGELVSKLPEKAAPSATAVAFFPRKVQDCYTILLGQESGQITVWQQAEAAKWVKISELASYLSHY